MVLLSTPDTFVWWALTTLLELTIRETFSHVHLILNRFHDHCALIYPVDTQRRFNVYKTSIRRR